MDEAKILRILGFLKQNFRHVAVSAEDVKLGHKVAQEAGVEFASTASLDELAGYIWAAKFVLTLDGGAECVVLQSASKRAQDVADEEIFEAVKNI